MIDADFALWVGNEGDSEVQFEASELCGFNLGVYDQKVVAGRQAFALHIPCLFDG